VILLLGVDGHTVGACPSTGDEQPTLLVVITDKEGAALRCNLTGRDAMLLAASLRGDADVIAPLERIWDAENDILDPTYGRE
jgi:hypothetical protein